MLDLGSINYFDWAGDRFTRYYLVRQYCDRAYLYNLGRCLLCSWICTASPQVVGWLVAERFVRFIDTTVTSIPGEGVIVWRSAQFSDRHNCGIFLEVAPTK